ncbi:MAG: carbon-nitrogen hydrolase family protein [Bacteroidota bacterium]
MKICAAQTRPVKGDIQRNIANHKKLIDLAVLHGAGVIIFPELSLTGYEPALAKELATDKDDSRFDDFQTISDTNEIMIGVGVPTKNGAGICISMILFQPYKPRLVYSKKYLHPDEEAFFISGQNFPVLTNDKSNIAIAICYELSIPEHSEEAFNNGAVVYIASVAKPAAGVDKAVATLAGIAGQYAITVLLSNCLGFCDNFESDGRSSIWDNKGLLTGQLNDSDEGILIIDTDTQEVIQKQYK